MPGLWDTNPDNVFDAADEQPVPALAATTMPRRCCPRITAAASGHPRTS